MRIIDNRKEEQKRLNELMIGDVFKYLGDYYLKINPIFDDVGDEINVLNLSCNSTDSLDDDFLVIQCYNAELVIK
jgi:hypothetical protein